MKRHFASVAFLLSLLLLPSSVIRAETSPEDEYVVIFNTIQDADALNEAANSNGALTKYEEAQESLKKFQSAHPGWNSKIIEFRMNYVAGKIPPLKGSAPPTAEVSKPAPKPVAPSAIELANKINALQEEIKKVSAEKSALETKVTEFSNASTTGGQQLSAAQENIKSLQKKNDELKSNLDAQKAKNTPPAETTVIVEAKKALAEAKEKLVQQTEAVKSLQKEKEVLQGSLKSATAAKKSDAELQQTKQALAEANSKLAEQTKAAAALAKDKEALQKNFDGISKTSVSQAEYAMTKQTLADAVKKMAEQTETIKVLMRDKDELQKSLVDAKTTASKPTLPANESAELKSLREQLLQVESERASLEAKLKEALAARPAVADSREMAKAAGRIKELEKENMLLKTSIEERQANILKGGDSGVAALEQMKRDLAETQKKLAAQNEAASAWALEKQAFQKRIQDVTESAGALQTLREESELLKKQLGEARRGPSLEILKQAEVALDESNDRLVKQVEISNTLAQEKEILQKRLDAFAQSKGSSQELLETRQALALANHKLKIQSEAAAILLADANVKLDKQIQITAALGREKEALRAENEILKKQAAAKGQSKKADSSGTDALKTKLNDAQARLAALQSDKKMLQMEKSALEQELKRKGGARPPKPSDEELQKIRQLELEREALQKKLQDATSELNSRATASSPSPKVVEMANQLASLRAKLDVLEARPVPYSQEELELFKKPDTQLTTKPAARSAKDLSEKSKKLLNDAKRDFAEKNFDKAESKYNEVLAEDPQNLYVLANLASIQLEMGKPETADANLKKAIALDPKDVYTLTILGNLKFRQKDYDAAIDALSSAAKIEPENAEVQNLLGITLSHKGMRGPAETALRRAIQIDPNFASAHNNLAVIYASQTPPLTELARWHYQKALAVGSGPNPHLEKMLEEGGKTPAESPKSGSDPK